MISTTAYGDWQSRLKTKKKLNTSRHFFIDYIGNVKRVS